MSNIIKLAVLSLLLVACKTTTMCKGKSCGKKISHPEHHVKHSVKEHADHVGKVSVSNYIKK